MQVETTRFGEIEIDEAEIIVFHGGLYGFEGEAEFILIEDEETEFFWLQSVRTPDLAFVVVEPWAFYPDYDFEIEKPIERELDLTSQKEVLVINIVVIPDNPEEMTMNLKAPLIINQEQRIGKQIILTDQDYPVKYPLVTGEEETASA